MIDSRLTSNILGCLIIDQESGQPLYSHFFDETLRKNPGMLPQKVKSGEMKMAHEFGKNGVYMALVARETPDVREHLRVFESRVDKVYPNGLRGRVGNVADQIVLQNIVIEAFVENKR
jgi:hypothetical protein